MAEPSNLGVDAWLTTLEASRRKQGIIRHDLDEQTRPVDSYLQFGQGLHDLLIVRTAAIEEHRALSVQDEVVPTEDAAQREVLTAHPRVVCRQHDVAAHRVTSNADFGHAIVDLETATGLGAVLDANAQAHGK
jgi:hypothetical protein